MTTPSQQPVVTSNGSSATHYPTLHVEWRDFLARCAHPFSHHVPPLRPSQHDDESSRRIDLLHIPSLTVKPNFTQGIAGILFYEERLLCFLLHLNNPKSRVVFVTSMPVSSSVIEYYLELLTDVSIEDARKRLFMISCYDVDKDLSLCEKLLKRPRTLERIKRLIDPERVVFSTYIHTDLERQLAIELGIQRATSPACSFWGTKLGSRLIFQELGIDHCFGVHKELHSVDEIVDATMELLRERPALKCLFIKYMEGVSGLGNAIWMLPQQSKTNRQDILESLLKDLKPVADVSPTDYLEPIPKLGAIIEERIDIKELQSPSGQGLIDSDGVVHVVSTHEQVFRPNRNGVYGGCTFPANEVYRAKIQTYCRQVGELLAQKGSRGERYGVDFLAWQNEAGEWQLQALEINLRNLGTTHPMVTLELVTKGGRHTPSGEFVDRRGRPRCYFALDDFEHESLSCLTPDDLFDMVHAIPELQYNKETTSGTIFYMMDSLSSFGKVGILCIAETVDKAVENFACVERILLEEAQRC